MPSGSSTSPRTPDGRGAWSAAGRAADVAACLTLAGLAQVPELRAGAIEAGGAPSDGRAWPAGGPGPAEVTA